MKSTRSSHWPLTLSGLLVVYVAMSGPLAGLVMQHREFFIAHLYFYFPLYWLMNKMGMREYLLQYWALFGWYFPL